MLYLQGSSTLSAQSATLGLLSFDLLISNLVGFLLWSLFCSVLLRAILLSPMLGAAVLYTGQLAPIICPALRGYRQLAGFSAWLLHLCCSPLDQPLTIAG